MKRNKIVKEKESDHKRMTVEEQIKDKLTKTCPCRQVTRAKIKEAIANGAYTLEQIKRETGAMTGSCHGTRCTASIERLIQQYKEEQE